MAEYIEREALLKLARPVEMGAYSEQDVVTVKNIKNAPAADVVEVVHCEKCSHWNNDIPYHEEYGSCDKHDYAIFHKNHYCGFGAKMDGKGEGE